MGKKKQDKLAFIPGFVPLGPSIWIQDPSESPNSNTLTTTTTTITTPTTTNTTSTSTSATSTSTHPTQPPTRPPLTFTASTSPLLIASASESTTLNAPDLILLCSWTGALPKHIAKYTLSYNSLYPSVPILILTTTIWDLAIHTNRTKIRGLAPSAQWILNAHKSRILLHAFSEGGVHKAVLLARAYLRATQGEEKLPIRAFIFDSAPGTPRYTSNVAAFKRSLPRNPVARALGLPIGASVLGVTWVLFIVFVGYENNLISETRRALNDQALWIDVRGAPRTYLFSERDDLINWRDVEKHSVESAEKLGLRSLLVRFSATGHCGHARRNEGVYWGAVRRTWEAWVAGTGSGDEDAVGENVAGDGNGVESSGENAAAVGDCVGSGGCPGWRRPVLTCVCCGEKLED